jgi:hypothetical protein
MIMSNHIFGITHEQWAALLANGRAIEVNPELDVRPVVKLCQPDGTILFLLAELNPVSELTFGLVAAETRPMLRFIDLPKLNKTKLGRGLRAESYRSDFTLTEAALCAVRDGRIRDYGAEPCPFCNPSQTTVASRFLRRMRLQ